jgi:hypothetical protein
MSTNFRYPVPQAALSAVKGLLAGGSLGTIVGLGAAALVPGMAPAVLGAMGVFFGGFNGSLIGLLSRLEGR